jgi:hypothetical protein
MDDTWDRRNIKNFDTTHLQFRIEQNIPVALYVKRLARQLVENTRSGSQAILWPREMLPRAERDFPVTAQLFYVLSEGTFISTRELPSISSFTRTALEENDIVSQREANA